MNDYFEKLTKRNWGAPWHAIIVFAVTQSVIKIFSIHSINNKWLIWYTAGLALTAIIYETWQMKQGQTKRGMAEDMLFNTLGYLAAVLPLLSWPGEAGVWFAFATIPAFLKRKDKLLIVIDAGHGGKFSGARAFGFEEKMINYRFAHRIANILGNKGHVVEMTRLADKELAKNLQQDLYERAKLANDLKADLFISIHCNACDNPQAYGFEVWTSKGETKADLVAESIIESVNESLPEIKIRRDKSDGDSDQEADFVVLKKTKMPAVLIELGFMTNKEDLEVLTSFLFLEKFSNAIVNGIC